MQTTGIKKILCALTVVYKSGSEKSSLFFIKQYFTNETDRAIIKILNEGADNP
jgi:hypothetical protein